MASRRERQAGRQGGEKQFCAAAEWEQKTNGGSYIRERQNERDRKRKEGQRRERHSVMEK